MGEQWRVSVMFLNQEGEWVDRVVLAAPRHALARFAPGVVAEALGVPAESVTETAVEPDDGETDGQPKRRRRTKAEMEAARAAEQAAEVANVPPAVIEQGPTDSTPEPFNPFAPK